LKQTNRQIEESQDLRRVTYSMAIN